MDVGYFLTLKLEIAAGSHSYGLFHVVPAIFNLANINNRYGVRGPNLSAEQVQLIR